MAFNLADLAEHTADVVPDRTALVCGDRTVTFGELDARANRLAHHLAAHGVGERDHVAIYSYNSLEYVEAMMAAYKLRAVPINVNYRYVEDELAYLFDNADVVACVYQASFAPRIAAVQDRLPKLRHLVEIDDGTASPAATGAVRYEDAMAEGSPERDFGPRDSGDLYILYTGGTTGMPKGVMWRHEDVWRTLGGGIDFVTGERITDEHQLSRLAGEAVPPNGLVLAPLMHGAAQWGTLGGLFKGVTNVLLPRFDPHLVWDAVHRYGIAVITITGDAMARPLIDALQEGSPDGPYDTSSLVAISSTAAVFSPVVKDQLFELLPDLFISEAVGSSEGGFNGMRLVEKGKTNAAVGDGGGLINVLLPRFDPHLVWDAVHRYGIAVITITGDAMARPLIDALQEGSPDGPYDTSSLVAISSTAAVFSPVVKDQLFELLPDLFISEAVGSSEGGFNGMRLVEKGKTNAAVGDGGGLINVPLGPDSKIIGIDDKPVRPGEVGRLARGGNVPIGYYKDPAKTAATFIDVEGERHSVPGDFARLELDGTMTLLGRGSQCINSGGEKIYPEEVESALKAHPKVFDALVIGVDDERWGQKVAAIVEPRPGEVPTLEELVAHCQTKLARYKVPRQLHLVAEMPRQPSGKPDYKRARLLTVKDPA